MLHYIIRRSLYMIPMMIAVSILAFIIITIPPGSFLDSYLARVEREGGDVGQAEIQNIKERYGLDQPVYMQYLKWVGGFIHGDFGESFKAKEPVLKIIKERIGWTVLISLGTLLFTWIMAIPIGLYSAYRQYSFSDYFFTFFGFIGVSIPNFLLALVIMYLSIKYTGADVGGLFSMRYIGEPWSFGKFIDMLAHIWVPIVVVGTGGMAGLIRVMRGQMLDELRKPYVQTARSKGLNELKVVLKHVTRIALDPIISTAGWMLPAIVSADLSLHQLLLIVM